MVKYEVHTEALDAMRGRGGKWAAYCNMNWGGGGLGHLQFLRHGDGCTFEQAPKQLPDTLTALNWRYQYVGEVNLETGEVDT